MLCKARKHCLLLMLIYLYCFLTSRLICAILFSFCFAFYFILYTYITPENGVCHCGIYGRQVNCCCFHKLGVGWCWPWCLLLATTLKSEEYLEAGEGASSTSIWLDEVYDDESDTLRVWDGCFCQQSVTSTTTCAYGCKYCHWVDICWWSVQCFYYFCKCILSIFVFLQ